MNGVAVKLGSRVDSFMGNSLVFDMYRDCGSINNALSVFIEIWTRGIQLLLLLCAAWAFVIFGQMIRLNKEPDEITFTGLLSARIHCGFLQRGRKLFAYMSTGPNRL
ncbi:hypothetical protein ISN44_As13g001460 [Arabidopsis suecica]|uniref:Uncharacterized protein n=1 Tax=Arabidopsis suecica TaxID=45249 RepID=A0A8T1XYD4_ARASU|nr:hypothetical protein ISN44_As13g001460 [Arabidopsis suecica]